MLLNRNTRLPENIVRFNRQKAGGFDVKKVEFTCDRCEAKMVGNYDHIPKTPDGWVEMKFGLSHFDLCPACSVEAQRMLQDLKLAPASFGLA